MTSVDYLTFPQIARAAATQYGSPFSIEDMRNALHSDFFSSRLSSVGIQAVFRAEVGGKDNSGRRRGVTMGRAGSPIGSSVEWQVVTPDGIRKRLVYGGFDTPLAADADLARFGRVPLNDWQPKARQYVLDNLAMSAADAEKWLKEIAPRFEPNETSSQPRPPMTLVEALERYSDPAEWAAFVKIEEEFLAKGGAIELAGAPVFQLGSAPSGDADLFNRREAALRKLDADLKARLRGGGFRITGFLFRPKEPSIETEISLRQLAILSFGYASSGASGGGLEYSGVEIDPTSDHVEQKAQAPVAPATDPPAAPVSTESAQHDGVSDEELHRWAAGYFETHKDDAKKPSEALIVQAAQKHFGPGAIKNLRDRMRKIPKPSEWNQKGRPPRRQHSA